jgi:hypothetical protein
VGGSFDETPIAGDSTEGVRMQDRPFELQEALRFRPKIWD